MAKSTNEKASKKSTSKRPPSDSEEEVADDVEDPEEEFEIEAVLKAKLGGIEKGKMAYFVKWKGYHSDENSWVAADDFHAPELLDEFWKRNESKKKPRQSTNGRKSVGGTSTRGKKSSRAPSVTDEEEEAPKKRGRASKASAKKDSDSEEEVGNGVKGAFDGMDVDEDDEEQTKPPKKKAKTAAGPASSKSSKTKARKASPDDDNDEVDDKGTADEKEKGDGHEAISHFPEWKNKKDWEDLIERIETVERTPDIDSGDFKLLVYFTTKDGRRGVQDARMLRKKCPQAIIDFYEGHLRWQAAQDAQEAD